MIWKILGGKRNILKRPLPTIEHKGIVIRIDIIRIGISLYDDLMIIIITNKHVPHKLSGDV